MKRLSSIVLSVAMLSVILVGPAWAAEEPAPVPHQAEMITGYDTVKELIERIGAVSFDSAGATFALMSQAGPREVSIAYRDLVPEAVGGTGTGPIPYAALAFAVMLFARFLRLVLRLAR